MHLLDRGGDVNVADARGGSLLHHAASKNHTEYGAAIIRRSAQVSFYLRGRSEEDRGGGKLVK